MQKLRLFTSLIFCLFFGLTMAQSPVYLQFEKDYSDDGRLTAHLNTSNFDEISSFQFSVPFPADQLVLDTIYSSSLQYFPASNYNILEEEGVALVLWFDPNGMTETLEDGSPLLTFEFQVLEGDDHTLYVTDCPVVLEFVTNAVLEIPAIGDVQLDCGSASGRVMIDGNSNCVSDDTTGLPNWNIRFIGSSTYTATTVLGGYFTANIPAGTYEVEVIPPSDLWGLCSDLGSIEISADSSLNLNIPVEALSDCPATYVEITTPFLRRCFPGVYFVNYGNDGTITAEDASISVIIDSDIEVTAAQIPWSSQVDSLYIFDVGDLPPGFQGSFKINIQVGCEDVDLGQTHCSSAHIYPDTICSSESWSLATVEADAICNGDSVTLELRNVGAGAMQSMMDVHVIEDDVIVFLGQFQLGQGEIFSKKYPADGNTYRIHAGQEINHPVSTEVFASVEACDSDGDGQYSSGFMTQFATNPDLPYLSVSCEQNVGSYDPNDKNASLRGVGPENYIEPNTSLDYLIRFQNTGTDTAFNIRIIDTLALEFDVSRIRILGASHPFKFEIKEGRILEFLFPDVLLEDSTSNEAASHGFIRYRIAQVSDLSPGTVIENKAAIFFDFNEPIITNTAMHTIQIDFLDMSTGTEPEPTPKADLKMIPNPASDQVVLDLPGQPGEFSSVMMYNLHGQLILADRFSGTQATLDLKNLQDGIYLLRVTASDGTVHSGRLMINKR